MDKKQLLALGCILDSGKVAVYHDEHNAYVTAFKEAYGVSDESTTEEIKKAQEQVHEDLKEAKEQLFAELFPKVVH